MNTRIAHNDDPRRRRMKWIEPLMKREAGFEGARYFVPAWPYP